MGVKLVSSSGGSVELVAPITASNFTHTVPAQTGTVLLKESTSGMSVPAFSAYNSNNQTPTVNTWTKLQINTKTFDTATCFDTTNNRFTPNVAGYYQIDGTLAVGGASSGWLLTAIYKNGGEVAYGSVSPNNTSTGASSSVSTVVYCNGSTDYIEFYFYESTTTIATQNSVSRSFMSGALVRAL